MPVAPHHTHRKGPLSIKEEFHRLVDELPESELAALRHRLGGGPLPDRIDLPTLLAQQAVTPMSDPLSAVEGIWPEEDSVDEFLAAREAWQHEGKDS